MSDYRQVHVVDHPLVQHKLSHLRDQKTGSKQFRELTEEVAMFLCYEATRDLPLEDIQIDTPLETMTARVIAGKNPAVLPILRAGLGMLNGVLSLMPSAKVGHIGLYRDHETLKPVTYYCKLPEDLHERTVLILDPMLATGGSASAAVDLVKKAGAQNIKFMCLLAAPEGIDALHKDHPDLPIYTAAIDAHLDEHAYIRPGLGDAGDRLFGTR